MTGIPQYSDFCHKRIGLKEGLCFEWLALGGSIDQDRSWSEVERRWYTQIKNHFERSMVQATTNQPPGFPWGGTGCLVDILRKKISEHFHSTEGKLVLLFSTLGTALDINTSRGGYHTDCFFYYRGSVVTIDLSLREKTREYNRPHLVLMDTDFGQDNKLCSAAQKIVLDLKEGRNTVSLPTFQILKYRLEKVYPYPNL